MKDKIKSLLGIETALGGWHFKPLLLLLGVLFFVFFTLTLGAVYVWNMLSFSLCNLYSRIREDIKIRELWI